MFESPPAAAAAATVTASSSYSRPMNWNSGSAMDSGVLRCTLFTFVHFCGMCPTTPSIAAIAFATSGAWSMPVVPMRTAQHGPPPRRRYVESRAAATERAKRRLLPTHTGTGSFFFS